MNEINANANKIENIYIVTVMTRLEENELGWPTFGSRFSVGWFEKFEDAYEAVRSNCCDIWETCYNYAVVEKAEAGFYPACLDRWFFKYNMEKNEYEEIETPDCVKHVCALWG